MKSRSVLSYMSVSLVLMATGSWRPAQAEPYLAVREGFKCSQCHVNMTGGGKRNSYGVLFAQTRLPARTISAEDLPPALRTDSGTFFDGVLNDHISIGGNLRVNNTSLRATGQTNRNSFGFGEGNLYLEGNLVGKALTFYVDETLAPGGAYNREAFLLVRGVPKDCYAKFGRFLLPYGFRLLDDGAFIREATGFTYATPDVGAEIGYEPGPWSLSLAATNGTQGGADNNTDKQISGILAWVKKSGRVGLSLTHNKGVGTTREAGGVFAGYHYGRFAILGELDRVRDLNSGVAPATEVTQNIRFLEVDYLLKKGWNLKLQSEFLDPNRGVAEDELTRYTVGVEPFLTQFAQVGVFFRHTAGPPQDIRARRSTVTAEVHFFF